MSAMKFLAQPGEHERRIAAGFDGNVRYEGATPRFDYPLVVILFTNRCGSNLFAEHMRNTGHVSGLAEMANYPPVLRQREKFELSSYPDLIAANAESHIREGKLYGIKASAEQLSMLHRWNILKMFSGMVAYQIVRGNLLDQAISMSIARQTGKWTSEQKTGKTTVPVFDFDTISKIIQWTASQNIAGRLLLEALDVPYAVFRYEEFTPDPTPHIRHALSILGIDAPDLTIPEPKLKKQANKTSAAFRQSYLEELMRHLHG